MKDFDLEKAKQGAEICTRDGHRARIVCYDAKCKYPIVALVEENVREWAYLYTQEGKFINAVDNHCKDLMLVEKKHEGWVVVLDGDYIGCRIYDTKEEAIELGKETEGYITVAKIEWEE